MSPREQRLAALGGVVLVLAAAFLLEGWIGERRAETRGEVESLEQDLERLSALDAFRDEIMAQRERLDELEPEPSSELEARDALLVDLNQAVAASGVALTDQQLLDAEGVSGWGQVRARLVVTGGEESVYRLLAQLRDPARLQAPEALVLTPGADLRSLEADITVRRLYRSRSSVEL